MKIVRSPKMERKILDKIIEQLSRAPRSQDKWHVSDLLYLRKAYWGRVDPQPMTDLQALYFTAGRAHHSILEACLGPKKWGHRADAGEFEKYNIYYSPDLRMPYPWEIKTSRAEKEPEDLKKGFEGYLKQLASYQAMDDTEKGGLLVLFLGLRKGFRKLPELRFYKVLMSKEEREAKVAKMKADAKALDAAVKSKNYRGLELCPQWMCKSDCPWLNKCKPWLDDPKRKPAKEKKKDA